MQFRNWVALVVAAILGGCAGGTLVLFLGADNKTATNVTDATITPTPKKKAPDLSRPVVLTAGEEDSTSERAYKCGSGLETVRLPTGKSIERDGSSFSLTDKPAKRKVYEDQESVKLTLKLGKNESLPAIIVNTAAHEKAPDLYPQTARAVNIQPGGKAKFVFRTSAFADNYENLGITDITLCLSRK
jgi:hypothetical protein